jgi:hypothetical protein
MKKTTGLVLLAMTLLTACETSQQRPLPQIPQTPTVTGEWVDPSGIVSSFQAGTFTTRTTDTNQMLASGTYVNISPTLVEISITSLVRKTQSKVNCALVTANQLNCTSQTGAQFSLSRRPPGSAPLGAAPMATAPAGAAPVAPAAAQMGGMMNGQSVTIR